MLSDLEELILECRNNRAKQHVAEAVACYRAGAYRASIITAWIAVCFDLVDKFAKLALSGDSGAQALVDKFENVRKTHDMIGSLKFERTILSEAKRLELLSPVQMVDIQRLGEDRNRCAHPSMSDEGEAFKPPAELARLHITNAVRHLLSREPAQGKVALDGLLRTLESPYFPTSSSLALEYLKTSPIALPKRSLFNNYFAVVLKNLTRTGTGPRLRSSCDLVFRGLREVQPVLWVEECTVQLNAYVARVHEEAELVPIWHFVCEHPEAWKCINALSQAKVIEFCKRLPTAELGNLDIYEHPALRDAINVRLKRASVQDYTALDHILFGVPRLVIDRALELYAKVPNYAEANVIGKVLCGHSPNLFSTDATKVLDIADANNQVAGSNELQPLLSRLAGLFPDDVEVMDRIYKRQL